MAAMITLLWLCMLLNAGPAAEAFIFANNENQFLGSLLVNQAVRLQRQVSQLQQQASQLQQQASQLQQQASQLQQQANKLQQQEGLLQQQASQLQQLEGQLQQQISQLQEQGGQLQQQASQLQKQEGQLQQQGSQLQEQGGQLQEQGSQLQEQSDQLRSLQENVSSVETSLERNTARLTMLYETQGKRASFRAVLSQEQVTADTPIPFTQEFATGGDQYNSVTGVFTVAIPGVYLLGFQIYPVELADFHTDLYINGFIRIHSRCYNSNDYTTSCAASSVFDLGVGETVWVQVEYGGRYWLASNSFFFGVLISPDP